MKVRNMKSPTSGQAVANQFIIEMGNGTVFQSYASIIAFKPKGSNIIYLGYRWDYSPTTSKYRNIFLGMDKKELKKRIEEGTAIVKDLDNPPKKQKITKIEVGMKLQQVFQGNLDNEDWAKGKEMVLTVDRINSSDSIYFKKEHHLFTGSYSEEYLIRNFKEVKC